MDCNHASELMMSYMDDSLTYKELNLLNSHLAECPLCAEDFNAYKEIVTSFSTAELVNAPEDFEYNIMNTINELSLYTSPENEKSDTFYWLCSVISIFLGIGFIISANHEAIMNYLYSKPELSNFGNMASPIIENFSIFLEASVAEISRFSLDTVELFWSARSFLVTVLALISIGLHIFNKNGGFVERF